MYNNFDINYKEVLKILIFIFAVLLGIFLAYKLSIYLAPFVIAFILASFMEPFIKLLVEKAKAPRKLAAAIALLLVLSTVGSLVVIVISKIVYEIKSIIQLPPEYYTQTYNNITAMFDRIFMIYTGLGLPVQVTNNIEEMVANLTSSWGKIFYNFLSELLMTTVSIPQILIFVIITILSTFFMTSDRHMIIAFFSHQLPESWMNKIRSIESDMFSALFGYLKAQLIMLTITFTVLVTGFIWIGVSHPFLFAVFISLLDALPIIGTGSILVPWSIYNFFTGDIQVGFYFLILYGICLAVRQMIEPKIVGQQIGLYPLVTLIAMYAGLNLLGFAGLILGPITVLLLKNILTGASKNGLIKEIIIRATTPTEKR